MKIFDSYWWSNLWYEQISTRIWPRQRWLTKVIPRTYRDKDILIELVLFKCLTDYCEVEIGLENKRETIDKFNNDSPKHQIDFEIELWKTYKLLKEELPKLEKELEEEWKRIPHFKLEELNTVKIDYEKTYGRIERAEQKIEDLKTQIMEWVVRKRGMMWT